MARVVKKKPKTARVDALIVEAVRAAQKYGNRSQKAFGEMLGVTERTVRRWETGGAELELGSAKYEALVAAATAVKVALKATGPTLQHLRAERRHKVEYRRRIWGGARKVVRRHG